MSLYVVVEGERTEPKLYRAWLPLLLPGLAEVRRIEDAEGRAFFLISGYGYPNYLDRLDAAVEDIRSSEGRFTHLLVCVDAEDRSALLRGTLRARKNELLGASSSAIVRSPARPARAGSARALTPYRWTGREARAPISPVASISAFALGCRAIGIHP